MAVSIGTWTNGRVVLDGEAPWPEGTRLVVYGPAEPAPPATNGEPAPHDGAGDEALPAGGRYAIRPELADLPGMTEEEQGDDPESIRRWLELEASSPAVPYDEAEVLAAQMWADEIGRISMVGGPKKAGGVTHESPLPPR